MPSIPSRQLRIDPSAFRVSTPAVSLMSTLAQADAGTVLMAVPPSRIPRLIVG